MRRLNVKMLILVYVILELIVLVGTLVQKELNQELSDLNRVGLESV